MKISQIKNNIQEIEDELDLLYENYENLSEVDVHGNVYFDIDDADLFDLEIERLEYELKENIKELNKVKQLRNNKLKNILK